MAALINIVVVVGVVITAVTAVPVFRQMRRHPNGLHILFFAEMWERFSYYGMRALLIFYLTQHFLFEDAFAASQYAAYVTLIFLSPLVGGLLADRYLGTRRAISFGALLLVAGHSLMAVEGEPADQVLVFEDQRITLETVGRGNQRDVFVPVGGERCMLNPDGSDQLDGACHLTANEDGDLVFTNLPRDAELPNVLPAESFSFDVENRNETIVDIFYLALAFIIMGVGFLKANISSIVGQLYERGDPRRDSGFTLYYYGINLGAFWSAVICGLLGETYGWAYGFGLAGIGMAIGWLVFMRRRLLFFLPGPPQLPDHVGDAPDTPKLTRPVLGPLTREHIIYLGGLLGVAVVWVLVQSPPAAMLSALQSTLNSESAHVHILALLGPVTLVTLAYIVYFMITQCTAVEAQRLTFALILISVAPVFWGLFEQAGASLNLFASRNTQLPGDGGFFTITASQTQSFNAGFILLFAPALAALWAFLARRNLDPNPALKFGLALVQVGLGFWVLVLGAQFADDNYRVPLIFLMLLYLLHTTGELCLSPVGMSAVTRLSPLKVFSLMMGVWFLSFAWAGQAVGLVSALTATQTVGGAVLDPRAALETSVSVFWRIGLGAICLGVALGAVSFWIKRLAHEDLLDAPPEEGSQPVSRPSEDR